MSQEMASNRSNLLTKQDTKERKTLELTFRSRNEEWCRNNCRRRIEQNSVITIKCNEHPTILFPYFD